MKHMKRLSRLPRRAQEDDEQSDPGLLFILDVVIGILRFITTIKGL
jgi:hypothetical protein